MVHDVALAADTIYRLVAENASDVVCQCDNAGTVLWVSPTVTEALGWAVTELVGTRAIDLVAADDVGAWPLLPPDDSTAPHRDVLVRLRRSDGQRRWYSGRVTSLFDAAGRRTGTVTGFRDVDDLVVAQQRARDSEARVRAAHDSLMDPHVHLEPVLDAAGVVTDFSFVEVNGPAAADFGLAQHDIRGSTWLTLQPGQVASEIFAGLRRVVRVREPYVADGVPYAQERRDGEVRYYDVRAVPLGSGVGVTWRDVTDRQNAAAALAASEAAFRLLAENAADIVYRAAPDGTTEWVSDGVERVLGFTPAEFLRIPGLEAVAPEDRESGVVWLAEILAGEREYARLRLLTADGGRRWVEGRIRVVRDERGQPLALVGGWRDVHEQVVATAELDRRARVDALTGLANRGEVFDRLQQLLTNRRHGTRVAVAFCDLDGFKAVNDTHGHLAGDRMLAAVADRVQECVRDTDVVARIGGDELLLVLVGVRDAGDADDVAEKVLARVSAPLDLEGRDVHPKLSIGITLAHQDDDPDRIVARADAAMYEAKQAGGGRVVRRD